MGQRQALQAKRRARRDSEGEGEARSEGQGPGKSSNVMVGLQEPEEDSDQKNGQVHILKDHSSGSPADKVGQAAKLTGEELLSPLE